MHVSVWDESGKTNSFHDDADEMGLSKQGYNFLGGIMKHAEAIAAITNPTVNSYKRINAPRTVSGATWSPNTGTTARTWCAFPAKAALRLPDGAANPYLLQAVILAVGLEGIASQADPGKPPFNLLDALRAFDKDESLKTALGSDFSNAYLKMKLQEWNGYASHFTQWERDTTLDI